MNFTQRRNTFLSNNALHLHVNSDQLTSAADKSASWVETPAKLFWSKKKKKEVIPEINQYKYIIYWTDKNLKVILRYFDQINVHLEKRKSVSHHAIKPGERVVEFSRCLV